VSACITGITSMSGVMPCFAHRSITSCVGVGCRVQGLGFRVQGAGCRVWGLGFRVQGVGFGV
jgi:hypothetical protein